MQKWKKRLILFILAFAVLWGILACTRYGEFTTYVPFSGRIFSVDPTRTDQIFVQSGNTGDQVFFETAEEREWIAQRLNNLRYSVWIPKIPLAMGGWSYRVAIEVNNAQYSYAFTERSMTVNGIVYILPGDQLDELRELVE